MELKNLLHIFKKHWLWLIIPLILVPIATMTFSKLKPSQPVATFSITFVPIATNTNSATASNTEDLKAANLFATTARSWLRDQALVSEILKNANINPSLYSNDDLKSLFIITLLENSFTLTTQVEGADSEQALNLANAAITLIKEKTKEFDQNSQNTIQFAVQTSTPYISQEKTDPMITLLLGILAGLAFGLLLVLSKHYVES
ncbi:MAG: hypothetical protein PHW50_02590 [Patescibacteria group bacterium]|nr:hypothetical protein [Patescibacteria group bacterium]